MGYITVDEWLCGRVPQLKCLVTAVQLELGSSPAFPSPLLSRLLDFVVYFLNGISCKKEYVARLAFLIIRLLDLILAIL